MFPRPLRSMREVPPAEVNTLKDIVYLATVMDLYSRRIIEYAFSHKNNKALTISALDKAFTSRGRPGGVIFHSDPGSTAAPTALRWEVPPHPWISFGTAQEKE